MRTLVASHGHPAVTRGGAEAAAYAQFQALAAEPGAEAFFLGCQRGRAEPVVGEPISQPFENPREYLYVGGAFDGFRLANRDPDFPAAFQALLGELRPDVLHLHHVLEFGIEAPLLARQVLPALRIVLTLHEYLLICHHHGQMVKRPGRALCVRARPDECHACFPEHTPSDFALRTIYLRRFLDLVDEFVSPSHFLAGRMIAWGLPAARVRVAANPLAPRRADARPRRPREGPLVVAYFGQISLMKGVDVLLDAAALLHEAGRRDVVFEVYGTAEQQPPSMLGDLPARLAAPLPNVRVRGAYLPEQVDDLMAGVDVVCVPSIWWENAPTVMAEAKRNGVPVVCSDLGGMAEMAGAGDLLFRVGVAADLADAVGRLETRCLPSFGSIAAPPEPAPRAAVNKIGRRVLRQGANIE
jgi:glycosyltransferase involved in cell wall biosynthesis